MADSGLRREDKIDERVDDMFSSHPDLQKMEQEAGGDSSYASAGADQAEAHANDPANSTKNINDTKSREQAQPWVNNTGQDTQKDQSGGRFSLKGIGKRKGATGAIIALFLGGGLLGGALLSPGLLLVHLKEDLVKKLDTRAATMAKREVKILADKLTKKAATSAARACDRAPSVVCRFKNPSSKMLGGIEGEGATITGADGKPINVGSGDEFITLPDDTKINLPNGEGSVAASDFADAVAKDPVKAGFFRRVFNPLYSAYSDSVFAKVMGYFKISKSDELKGNTDEEKQKAMAEEVQSGEKPVEIGSDSTTSTKDPNTGQDTVTHSDSATGIDAPTADATSKLDSTTIKKVLGNLFEHSAKGGVVSMVAGLFCGAKEFASMLSNSTRVVQIAQLVRFSMIILTVSDMIKAGTAKPEDVALLGTMLTTIMKDNKGNVTKNAATDGYGMRYALGQGLPPQEIPKGSTSHFTSYIAGGGWAASLASLSNIGGGPLKKVCDGVNSPVGSFILSIAGGPTAIFGWIAGDLFSGPIAELAAPLVNKLVGALAGTLISSTISGEDAGDAYSSGTSQLLSQTTASGGGSALSPSEAIAFENNVAKPYQIAQAQIDQAALSPFDATSRNTFLGSIYDNLIPTYSDASSLTTLFSAPFQLLGTAVGIVNKPVFAATDNNGYGTTQEYDPNQNSCGDPNLGDAGVAAGPYCNIINAVPTNSLSKDPLNVLDELSGQYDPTTGDPTSGGLQDYKTQCVDQPQSPDTAKKCRDKDSSVHNDYSLYFIDQSVQKNMDGEDPSQASSGGKGASYTNPIFNDRNAPDPGVINDGTNYYIYTTGDFGLSGNSLATPTATSTGLNLQGGTFTNMWAPDIAKIGSTYVLTYAGFNGAPDNANVNANSKIYYATSSSAGGPFKSGGALIQNGYTIDPHIFVDSDGTPWLSFGGGVIYLVKLKMSGEQLTTDGAVSTIYSKPPGVNTVENSWIQKKNGMYYLFFSQGDFRNKSDPGFSGPEYSEQVVKSQNITGPYNGPSKTVLSGDGGQFFGPGGGSITTDSTGQDWFVYSAWYKDNRALLLDPLSWYGDGWPLVSNGHPSTTSQVGPS